MTSSLLAVRKGSQTPRVANYPTYTASAADEVIDLAAAAGLELDPWQQFVLRHGLGVLDDQQWAAFMVSVWVARQNGKGAIIEALELAWLFLFGERLILHSAHEYKTAQEAFLRIKGLIENCPDLDRMVNRYWQANGEQGIELVGGQRLRFVARSRTSGRGFSGDKNVLDEAQELTVEQMAALLPTMSARPNPQLWMFGTPPEYPDAWVYNVYVAGEEGSDPRLAHFNWGAGYFDPNAPEDVAKLDDVELRYATNPAMGIRITEEFVAGERTLLREKFAHERLGMWLPRATGGAGVIPEALWREQVTERERPADVALAVQVNYQRTHTAIVAVGPRAAGGLLTSMVDYRTGTQWVVERLVELKERWNPVAIAVQDKGPTGSLLEEMAKVGLTPSEDRDRPQRGDLAIPWADDVADAYGMYVDAAHQRRLWHLDEAPLNTALATSGTRPLSGGTAWDYKVETAAPLIGSTLALWAYLTRIDAVDDDYNPWDHLV